MKLFKRIGAAILSLAIIMSFGAFTVGATDPTTIGSITFQNDGKTLTKSSFSAYKIVDWTYNGGGVYTNMKLNSTYKVAIENSLGLALTSSDNDVLSAVSKLTDAKILAKLAVDLKALAATKIADYSSTDGTGVISGMALGYYLVVETQNGEGDGTVISKPMLVRLPEVSQSGSTYTPSYNITINIKTSKANIEKKIVISSSPASVADATNPNDLFDTSTAALNDTVYYRSLATIPTYPLDATNLTYKISDEMTPGLTLNQNSIVVSLVGSDSKTLVANTDYTVATSAQTFSVVLTSSENIKLWGNNGDKVLVTYSAVVNNNAVSGKVGNPNSTNLTYSVKSGDTTGYKTPDDTVITYTFDLTVEKQDDAAKALAGAEFTLYKKDGTGAYVQFGSPMSTVINSTTNKATVTFPKMNQGDYKLVETKAPAGFNTYDPIEFTVKATNTNDGDTVAKFIPDLGIQVSAKYCGNTNAAGFLADWSSTNPVVKNNYDGNGNLGVIIMDSKGFQLPLSGGVGTAVFTGSGIALVAVAGALLLVYNKKRKAANH